MISPSGPLLESRPGNFRPGEQLYNCRVCIYIRSMLEKNLENDTMKLSVNETKFTGL